MVKVIFKILILFLIVSISVFAGETGALKGVVTDIDTGEKLLCAFVRISSTELCSMVNDNGEFFIDSIPPGFYEIIVEGRNHITKSFSDLEILADSTIVLYTELKHVFVFIPHRPEWGLTAEEIRRSRPETGPYLKSSIMNNGRINERHTCDGGNMSPPFWIKNLPENTKSLILMCDTWTNTGRKFIHWILFNIPPDIGFLPEGIVKTKYPTLIKNSGEIILTQGINDFGEVGYLGPCPHSGMAQTYFFRLYALDKILRFSKYKMKNGIDFDELSRAMDGHVIVETGLFARYWDE